MSSTPPWRSTSIHQRRTQTLNLASDDAPTSIHWMVSLDHYKSVAHDFLGFPVPGLPETLNPSHNALLPPFIHRIPTYLADEDVQYLVAKVTFALPDERLQNDLLKCFVLHVHLYLPILDLPIVLEAIANNRESRVNLLLYHAAIFSTITFIDPKHIHRAGTSSGKKKRASTSPLSKALVSSRMPGSLQFNVEKDWTVSIHSVLLMAYWHATPDNLKDFQNSLERPLSLAALVTFPGSKNI
ncbi:hypothetical protein BDW59DRAFT_157368 [Aspergillus cavernicola]|uniref:Uncharacterized protein n=1 Tax=Aspergillus cavernicola TaxID=176166 RepID=A0ABR4IXT5_9EURO